MDIFVKKYKILGCLNRLRMMNILLKYPDGLYVCEIGDILEIKQYNISKHLNLMKMVGLVEEEKQGKLVLYKPYYIKENHDLFTSILTTANYNKDTFESDVKRIKNIVKLRANMKCFRNSS